MAPMRKSRWHSELEAATTDKDVLNVARDYVAMIAREEFLSIPVACRPGRIASCDDVMNAALKLVQESLKTATESEGVKVLREVSEFFAAAAAKLTEIHAPHPEDR